MPTDGTDVSETAVVQAAADAAENVIFSRYDRAEIRDFDVTVSFEDALLEVDVYLDVEGEPRDDPDRVADDAALAARRAADELLT